MSSKILLKSLLSIILLLVAAFIVFVPSVSITLQRENPFPTIENLIQEKRYVEANTYLNFFQQYNYVKANPLANKYLTDIETERGKWSYQANKILEGLMDGNSDEDSGKLAADISDWIFIGDIRDLSHEGKNYLDGKEVSKVTVALSVIGIAGTITTVSSAGTSSALTVPFKKGVSMLKAAVRVNKMPKWLAKLILKHGEELAELIKLGDLSDLVKKKISHNWQALKNTDLVKNITHAFKNDDSVLNVMQKADENEIREVVAQSNLDTNKIDKIVTKLKEVILKAYRVMNTQGGADLLSATTDLKSLEEMETFTQLFEKDSFMVYKLGGQTVIELSQSGDAKTKAALLLAAPFGEKGFTALTKMNPEAFSAAVSPALTAQAAGEITLYPEKNPLKEILLALLCLLGIVMVWLPWSSFFRSP